MTASVFTLKHLYRAYHDCRRRKRNNTSALAFEMNAEERLIQLTRDLSDRTWHPSPSFCFVAKNDKFREIFAADFSDRIVHHLLVRYLEPLWEPVFIYDAFASRKHKGTHGALNRLDRFLNKVTANQTRRAWYAQLDIRSFFPSIDRKTLLEQVLSRLDNAEIRWLSQVIIEHDPTKEARFACPRSRWRRIPPSKSLFSVPAGKGLPIGNITSQFFANVYLTPLDYFVKHTLKARFYIRYVDDMVLLHTDSDILESWSEQISRFLQSQLELTLHPERKKLAPVSNGIDFLGYVVKPTHRIVRKKVVFRCKERLFEHSRNMVATRGDTCYVHFPPSACQSLHASFNSYLGIFRHARTRRLVTSLFDKNRVLSLLFYLKDGKAVKTWALPVKPVDFYTQYQYFRKRFKGIIWIQIGPYYECFDRDSRQVAGATEICPRAPRKGFYAGARTTRQGLKLLLAKGKVNLPVLCVTETGKIGRRIKERAGSVLILPRSVPFHTNGFLLNR